MMIAPDYRHHILCPFCGVTTAINETRVYVQCRNREVASDIASQLKDIIAGRRGKDLSEEEITILRQRFSAWEDTAGWV